MIGTSLTSWGSTGSAACDVVVPGMATTASLMLPSGDSVGMEKFSSKLVPGCHMAVWYDDDVWHHLLLLTQTVLTPRMDTLHVGDVSARGDRNDPSRCQFVRKGGRPTGSSAGTDGRFHRLPAGTCLRWKDGKPQKEATSPRSPFSWLPPAIACGSPSSLKRNNDRKRREQSLCHTVVGNLQLHKVRCPSETDTFDRRRWLLRQSSRHSWWRKRDRLGVCHGQQVGGACRHSRSPRTSR